jgi:hypothetical protein
MERRKLVLVCAVLAFLGLGAWSLRVSAQASTFVSPRGGPGPDRVDRAVRSDVSAPLRTIRPIPPAPTKLKEGPENPMTPFKGSIPKGPDAALQTFLSPFAMPAPIQNFEGQPNLWAVFPPDTNGDVGRNHYIQMVNLGFQIFSKTGVSLYGPANNNTLWTGFGGLCETTNNGDPIVLYDPMADRWLLSQFAFASTSTPTHQCFAISTSPDPLGSYYRYDFQSTPNIAPNRFEDYPHIGVWPDAYYMTTNEFTPSFVGGGNFAFNRVKMLQGDPSAEMIYIHNPDGGQLPTDLDGPPPPAGTPNFIMEWYDNSNLAMWKFHVDFVTPALSTVTGPLLIPVTPFSDVICTGVSRGACIDQPGTPVKLEGITDRLMHRVQYRNFGDHESLIVHHTVNAAGTTPGVAGLRWYEIRDPNGARDVYQQSTYSPDSTHRWMGSAAMDGSGDLAIGYSVSSSTVFPGIRYAGRLVSDPLNTLAQGEATLINGGGSQTATQNANDGRWGDYSMLAVDPADECTFWYTQEFIRVTTLVNWNTRIGSFRFPSCVSPGTPTPVPTATGVPPTATSTPTATAQPCFGSSTITGSLTSSDPVQNGRLVRSGAVSSCAVPVTCPGVSGADTAQRHYDAYTFINNTGTSQCVTVNVDARACSTGAVYSVTYLGSFDPTNLCANFLAQAGQLFPVENYSFSVAAGATFVVVVHEASANQGCALYTLSVNGCLENTPTPTPTFTPTNTPTATPTPGTNGCDVGYWKNHTSNWPTPYTTATTLGSKFTLPTCGNINTLGSDTFLTALNYNGGSQLRDAAKTLLRQAVAALLNAASGVGYPLHQDQIKAEVNAALASCNRQTILAEANRLEAFNKLHCPLR